MRTDTLTPSETEENESDMPGYTSTLQEYGNREGVRPSYIYDKTQSDPQRFVSTATFGKRSARGKECGNKKSAKHEASKALLDLLNSTTNGRKFS